MKIVDPFVPTPQQYGFLHSTAKVPVFRGGLGSGKTAIGAIKARNLAILNPGCMGLVAAPTFGQVKNASMVEVLKWTPEALIKRVRESTTAGLMVELINGSKIIFASADKPRNMRGPSVAWGWFDEADFGSEEAFRLLLSRIRDPRSVVRQLLITTSPNGTRSWLYRKWQQTGEGRDPDWEWFRASSRDNPHTGTEYVDSMAAHMSATAAQQEIEGEFVGAEGLVYGADFDERKHLIDYDYDPGRPVHLGVDFGFRKSAVLMFQQRPEDNAWVAFDEEMLDNSSSTDMVRVLDQKPYRQKIVAAVHDPAGLNNQQDTGAPLVQVLQDHGIPCESPEERKIARGIETVRFNLRPYRGNPRLYFARRLKTLEEERGWTRGLIKDFSAYHYPERGNTDVPEHDDSSHSMDALRYFCMVRLPVGGGGSFGSFRRW